MKHFALLALIAAPASAHQPAYPAKGSPEQRAVYEQARTRQAEFEQGLFLEAGFQPIETVAAQKRAVKRALFFDPYMMLDIPGVEVERLPDGSVTLTIVGGPAPGGPSPLPASAWDRLTGLQGAMFRPKPYEPWDPPAADAPIPPRPPMCHGWLARFGVADETGTGSGSWGQCGGGDAPGLTFATEIARLAIATRPDCTFDADSPFRAFETCFSPSGD